jgi:hypothetical protein
MVAMTQQHDPQAATSAGAADPHKPRKASPAQRESLCRAVAQAQAWITGIYRLDLDLRAEHFLVEPETAMRLLPPDSPRSGVVVVEAPTELSMGMYLAAEDADDPGTVLEETSHLLYLAWLADRDWSVSRLVLELQSDVDRYAVARIQGQNGMQHFEGFEWAGWLDVSTRELYATAHRCALRYCRGLERRHPRRSDTPAMLCELRSFYRATPSEKLNAA